MQCIRVTKHERRMENVKEQSWTKNRFNGWVNHTDGFTCICKVDQLERGWNGSLDIPNHWRGNYSPSINSGHDPVLQLCRHNSTDGFQKREESRRGSHIARCSANKSQGIVGPNEKGGATMSQHIKIFLILTMVLILSIVLTSLGVAYAGGVRGIGLFGVTFFLTFGILLVLAQLIPAGILLSSMFATTLTPSRRHEMPIRAS